MHSIKLEIQDSVFDKVIYFLQNLPKNEVNIIEESRSALNMQQDEKYDIHAYSDHSANTIDEWKVLSEDDIWK